MDVYLDIKRAATVTLFQTINNQTCYVRLKLIIYKFKKQKYYHVLKLF